MQKPSQVNTVQKKTSKYVIQKINGDINRGVSHKIKRPIINKAKERVCIIFKKLVMKKYYYRQKFKVNFHLITHF